MSEELCVYCDVPATWFVNGYVEDGYTTGGARNPVCDEHKREFEEWDRDVDMYLHGFICVTDFTPISRGDTSMTITDLSLTMMQFQIALLPIEIFEDRHERDSSTLMVLWFAVSWDPVVQPRLKMGYSEFSRYQPLGYPRPLFLPALGDGEIGTDGGCFGYTPVEAVENYLKHRGLYAQS